MKNINVKAFIKKAAKTVVGSIAFYPSLIGLVFFALAAVILSINSDAIDTFLSDKASFLVLENADTNRAVLSTIIGGVISLTVFSFSMVMIILNQASSNFSPRLLPGLVSNKQNQIVLGIYIGTIIFNILVLMSTLPQKRASSTHGFAVLLGIFFGLNCLALFIYFIHATSNNIQIENILKKKLQQSKKRLNELIDERERQQEYEPLKIKNPTKVFSPKSSFFQGVSISSIKAICKKEKLSVIIHPYKGSYILRNSLLYSVDGEISEEVEDKLIRAVLFLDNDNVDQNYLLGVKQITEVGIKAMSPGINDPGTALLTIDYLTEIFALRMKMNDFLIHEFTDDDDLIIQKNLQSFCDLLKRTLMFYRTYCKEDVIVMNKLKEMLDYLKEQEALVEEYKTCIDQELQTLVNDAKLAIENKVDLQWITEV